MKGTLTGRVLAVLVTMLVIASLTLLMGREESRTVPSPNNTRTSGLAALTEILQRVGFEVEIDRSDLPKLDVNALVIAPCFVGKEELTEEPVVSQVLVEKLRNFVKSGGKVLELSYRKSSASSDTEPSPNKIESKIASFDGLTVTIGVPNSETLFVDEEPQYSVGGENDATFLNIYVLGSGILGWVPDATGATNGHIGTYDNAKFFVEVVRRLAGNSRRVTILTSTFGESDHTGLIGAFGSWAVATQWQVVLLIVLIAWTLGQRFGPLVTSSPKQRTGRELVDSVAIAMKRSRKSNFAAGLIVNNTIERLKRRKHLPSHTPPEKVLLSLPIEAQTLYADLLAERQIGALIQKLATFMRLASNDVSKNNSE